MLVTVVSVSRENKPGKSGEYGVLTVAFRNQDGKLAEKKLMSFQNPQVFKHFEKLPAGSVVNVKSEKIGDYWQWTSILAEGADVEPVVTTGGYKSTTTVAPKSNYETSEERATRQRLIVRQSSITAAIGIMGVGAKTLEKNSVIDLAKEIEDWVFREEVPAIKTVSFDDIEDDIPY